jgi:hypothetical protein
MNVYQLWVYYERDAKWVMEYMHEKLEWVEQEWDRIKQDGDTPCYNDWYIARLEKIK